MKVVILAGGYGSRLSEETNLKPKPLVEIGGMPILWHIMKYYSYFGFNEFIICCGYKGREIKDYFLNYQKLSHDFEINLSDNSVSYINEHPESWKIKVIDTGPNTMTGGRVKRIRQFLDPGETFALTYGDGLTNVDLNKELDFHDKNGKLATVLGVNIPSRFGTLSVKDGVANSFREKPESNGLISGGYFFLNEKVIDLIEDDECTFEQEPLKWLANNQQLSVFEHRDFWQPMDTLKEKMYLEKLWNEGCAPWKIF